MRSTLKYKRYKGLLYGILDRVTDKNKNKLCTSKFVANKFKDKLTKQSYIRI